jgi:hypothetical protein
MTVMVVVVHTGDVVVVEVVEEAEEGGTSDVG